MARSTTPTSPAAASAARRPLPISAAPRRVEERAACGQGEWHAHSTAQYIQLGTCRVGGMRTAPHGAR